MDKPNNYSIGQKKQLYKFLKQEISILWVEYLSEGDKKETCSVFNLRVGHRGDFGL